MHGSPGFVSSPPPKGGFWKQSKWPCNMIHPIPRRNPRRIDIQLASTHSVGPSSTVWSELGLAPPFPPMKSPWSVIVTGSRSRVWSGPESGGLERCYNLLLLHGTWKGHPMCPPILFTSHTPLVPQSRCEANLDQLRRFHQCLKCLKYTWSRAFSLVCEVALRSAGSLLVSLEPFLSSCPNEFIGPSDVITYYSSMGPEKGIRGGHQFFYFTYSVGSSSEVWSELGAALPFPPMLEVLEVYMVTGSQPRVWSCLETSRLLLGVTRTLLEFMSRGGVRWP